MSLKPWVLLCGLPLLSGCFGVNTSQAPLATTYPATTQQRMQAAYHWEVLARHEAKAIMADRRLDRRALYLKPPETETAFSRGFRSLLTSELVRQGATVRTSDLGAATVTFDVQVVAHRDRQPIRPPQGALTALAAGIAVATIPFNHWSEPSLALIPAAGLVDLFSGSWTSESDEEVIITVQADEYQTLLYSSSNLYYINPGDSGQYGRAPAATAERGQLKVSSQW
ncbi:hypothetical protein [Salinicola tamaricis]|uniref:hypothetical protein n=1 Tax=Salinicola tamaricis TaxID=1771309 RepID=UPI000D0A1703|nr:hypothetical protein [Salinicola tamaricis]